jgi:hypothetical protein
MMMKAKSMKDASVEANTAIALKAMKMGMMIN